MGLGNLFTSWTNLVYMDQFAKICYSGYESSSLEIDRGVRQCCPLSPILFNLITETLAFTVHQSEQVRGWI